MKEKPKSVKEPILTTLGMSLIGVISIASSTFALLLFSHFFQVHNNPVEGRSIVFASFALNSLIYIFAYRSMRLPLYRMRPLKENMPLMWAVISGLALVAIAFLIPGLRSLLGIVPLSISEWFLVAGVALGLLLIVEVGKAISHRVHLKFHTEKG